MVQETMSDTETVTLGANASGHGIHIVGSTDDGVIIGDIEHGSPAHQSEKIATGIMRCDISGFKLLD